MSLTPNISVNLPALDYNIVEDMKKTCANISLLELVKTQGQWDILLRALGKTSADNTTSASKVESTSPSSLTTMLNTLQMEEENFVCHPLLLSFEIFNCSVHNYLVEFDALSNIMPLSISKQINVQWSQRST